MLKSNMGDIASVLRVAVSSDAANYNDCFNNIVWLSDYIASNVKMS